MKIRQIAERAADKYQQTSKKIRYREGGGVKE
jgi:hypothetical protein